MRPDAPRDEPAVLANGHLDEGDAHALVDGALPDEAAARVIAHVAVCARCAAVLAEARGLTAASTRILGALDDVPGGVVPVAVERASGPAPVAPRPAVNVRRRWTGWPVRAAAALLLAAVGGTAAWRADRRGRAVGGMSDSASFSANATPASAMAPAAEASSPLPMALPEDTGPTANSPTPAAPDVASARRLSTVEPAVPPPMRSPSPAVTRAAPAAPVPPSGAVPMQAPGVGAPDAALRARVAARRVQPGPAAAGCYRLTGVDAKVRMAGVQVPTRITLAPVAAADRLTAFFLSPTLAGGVAWWMPVAGDSLLLAWSGSSGESVEVRVGAPGADGVRRGTARGRTAAGASGAPQAVRLHTAACGPDER